MLPVATHNMAALLLAALATVQSAVGGGLFSSASTRALVPAGSCPQPGSTAQTLYSGDFSTFRSPNYPDSYGAFTGCTWSFQATGGAVLRLTCEVVHLSFLAFVYVTDGTSTTKYFCLLCALPLRIDHTFSSQQAKVEFRNAFFFGGQGFSCKISASVGSGACTCGVSNALRIVGGTAAREGEFPWMAGLVDRGEKISNCGGVLINSQYVLTAAHCTEDELNLDRAVRLGVLDEATEPPEGLRRRVLQIYNHPSYNGTNYDYDIALLRIEEVDFNSNPDIRPICLPTADVGTLEGRNVISAGWGSLSSGGSFPTVLQKVSLPVYSNAACRDLLRNVTITDQMLCASAEGKDSCQGDSGGPVMLPTSSYYQLVGIVSFGLGCGDKDVPGVNTRVSTVLQWIRDNSAGGRTCPPP